MNVENNKRLRLAGLLWRIKQEMKKQGEAVSFKALREDSEYRAKVFSSAVKKNDANLSSLVNEIILFEKEIGNDQLQFPSAVADRPVITTVEKRTNALTGRKGIRGSIFISLFVVSFIGYVVFNYSSVAEKSVTPENSFLPPENIVLLEQSDNIEAQKKTEEIRMRLHGSNTVGDSLAPLLIETYLKELGAIEVKTEVKGEVEKTIEALTSDNRLVTVEIHAHGSSTSFAGLDAGAADMGMSSRKIKDKEVGLLKERFGDLTLPFGEHVIGLDGIAIIVNKANSINQLNTEQLASLFSGEIRNWSTLGGADIPVSIYARDKNSGTWDTFKNLVLKKHNKKLNLSASRHESSVELSDLVADNLGAIGFIGLPYVRESKLLAIADDKTSQAIIPTVFTVGTEDYPLSRRLYFYTPENQTKFMRGFVSFTESEAGQDVVKESGFISQNLYTVRRPVSIDAPETYKTIALKNERLSLSFRFHSGSNNLDNKALRDMERLVDFISKKPDSNITLFGFSDSIGTPDDNLELSKGRAQGVSGALESRGVFPRLVAGLGEVMPVASNLSRAGRNKNRRVEVWIEN